MAGSRKVYIAHCPNCNAVLREISPVPLSRCQGCKKYLLVKSWKLEELAVDNENLSAEKHSSKEKSEDSVYESTQKCYEKPIPYDVSNSIDIDSDKNGAENSEERDKIITVQQLGNFSTDRDTSETGNSRQESSSYDEATCQTNKVDASPVEAIILEKKVESREDEEDDRLAKLGNLSLQKDASENELHPDEKSQSIGLACLSSKDPPHTQDADAFRMNLDRKTVASKCIDEESVIFLGQSDSFSSHPSASENELDFCGLFQSEEDISLTEESVLCLMDANAIGTTNEENEETASYHSVECWQTDQKGGISPNCTVEDEFKKHMPTFADESVHVSREDAPFLIQAVASGFDKTKIPSSPEKMASYLSSEHDKFEAGCNNVEPTKQAQTMGSLTEASLAYCNDSIFVESDGKNQCLSSETCGKSRVYEKTVSIACDPRPPRILSAAKPVSMRTFRSRKIPSSSIPANEEGRSVLVNKNEGVLSEAAEEQYCTLSSPSESSGLCCSTESINSGSSHESSPMLVLASFIDKEVVTTESVLSSCNHELSPASQARISHPVDKEGNQMFLVNENENVVSDAMDQVQHFSLPHSSESTGLCLSMGITLFSPSNHESSSTERVLSSRPVDKEETESFLLNKNEDAVSEGVEELNFTPSSESSGLCMETVFPPRNYESSPPEQIITSSFIGNEQGKSFLVNNNENVISETVEELIFSPSESSGFSVSAERLLSLSNYEPSPPEQALTSHSIGNEEGESFLVNKNENVVSQAVDQEEHFTPQSSSVSGCLCPGVERVVLSPNNLESPSMKEVLTSHPSDNEEVDKSDSVNRNAGLISQVAEQELPCTSASSSLPSSESNGLCSTKESVLSPSYHDSSPTKQVPTSHPADTVGTSALANENDNVVSDVIVQVKHFTSSTSSSSESSGVCLTSDTVASPIYIEPSPAEQVLPSHPENQSMNAAPAAYSSENDAKPESNGTSTTKAPGSTVHALAADRKMDPSAIKRGRLNPNHLELLRKIDELKVEITKSIGQRRKGNEPQRTRDAAQATEEPLVSNGHSEQDLQQLPPDMRKPPLQMPISEKPKIHSRYRRERNQDVPRISPSSSSASDGPEAVCSSSGSPTTETVGRTSGSTVTKASPHMVSSSPYHHRGNRKLARVRRLQKRDNTPVVKRHCRPLLGAAPFIVCYECLEVLQMPEGLHFSEENKKLRCGACSKVLKFTLMDQTHVVPSSCA